MCPIDWHRASSVAAVLSLVAFLGGLIHYAIENNRIAHDYLVNYTNAAFIVKKGLKLPEDGLYSGFDSAEGTYDKSTWIIRRSETPAANGRRRSAFLRRT